MTLEELMMKAIESMEKRERLFSILTLTETEVRTLDLIGDKWGQDRQILKMGEEGAELASAVLKNKIVMDGLTWDQVVEEMVDVYLLLCQVVSLYFTGDDETRFHEVKNFKLNRELERIANAD